MHGYRYQHTKDLVVIRHRYQGRKKYTHHVADPTSEMCLRTAVHAVRRSGGFHVHSNSMFVIPWVVQKLPCWTTPISTHLAFMIDPTATGVGVC